MAERNTKRTADLEKDLEESAPAFPLIHVLFLLEDRLVDLYEVEAVVIFAHVRDAKEGDRVT